ncbi:MAG TPA: C40 family peptidase, partial [Spirochaetota bacterium]|nr:C40 family peptidase [Spirochaetota bacterium]
EDDYIVETDNKSNETTGPISGLDALINTIKDSKTLEKFNRYIVMGIEKPLVLNGYPPETIADSSLKYRGIPYVSGSCGWNGVDCSGLTKLVMEEFKIEISRSANEQGRYGVIIPTIDELKKGDLLFFINTYPTSNFITHVGIYLGDYKFINANSYYGKVMIDNVADKYWKPKFLYGTRGR